MPTDHYQEQLLESQIELQSEIVTLLNCNARLRHIWLQNQSSEVLAAMAAISARLGTAEKKLERVIEAVDLSDIAPVKSLAVKVPLKL